MVNLDLTKNKERFYGFKNSDSFPPKTHPMFQQVNLMGHKIATKEMEIIRSLFSNNPSVTYLFSPIFSLL